MGQRYYNDISFLSPSFSMLYPEKQQSLVRRLHDTAHDIVYKNNIIYVACLVPNRQIGGGDGET